MPSASRTRRDLSSLDARLLEQAGDWEVSHEERVRVAEDSFDRIERALMIPIERIAPMRDNPRQSFRHLDELAESIADRGLIQPLVVRRDPERPAYYLTVAGARRLMAATILRGSEDPGVRARVAELPCLVVEEADDSALASALAENLARDDLTRSEAMEAMLRLQEQYGWSGREIARRTGRNQGDVSVLLRVGRDEELAGLVRSEALAPSAAGELVQMTGEERRDALADVREGTLRTVAEIRARSARRRRDRAPVAADAGVGGVIEFNHPPTDSTQAPPDGGTRELIGSEQVPERSPGVRLAAAPRTGAGVGGNAPRVVPSGSETATAAVRERASALREAILTRPLAAWEPGVAEDIAAIREASERVSGRPRTGERRSSEEMASLTHRLLLAARELALAAEEYPVPESCTPALLETRELVGRLLGQPSDASG